MGRTREAGTLQQYMDAAEPFLETLENLLPDVIVVWGVRLWNNLPNVLWTDGDYLNVDGYDVQNGYYSLASGKKVKAVCVYHPSTGYNLLWHKVINHYV